MKTAANVVSVVLAIMLAQIVHADPSDSRAPTAIAAHETFSGTWPFVARYTDAPGFPMHYIDEGHGTDTLLLLHGEPT